MNWLISAETLQNQKAVQTPARGGSALAPEVHVGSHRTAGQWHLFPTPAGSKTGAANKKMWHDVLSAFTEQ